MRWFRNIIMAISLVLLVGACQRRPFAESRTKVALNLIIKTDIVNHTQTDLPENMRVDLYDPQTGQIRYTDYVGPHGGYIYPSPGVYDMIVYSIGSESTIVHKTQNINTIEVYTNEVSSFVKGQIAQFLAKRSQVAKDRLAKKYAALMQGGEPIEKAPQLNEDELVVNQPDHIFVGRYHNLEVPVIYEHDEIREIYVEVEAQTLVETWQVEIRNLEGAHWIGSTVSLMSGQAGSVHMGLNKHTDKIVSVYFDMKLEDKEDGGKCLKGKLNTFGLHPDNLAGAYLDLNIKDLAGKDFIHQFEVTDQFYDNPEKYILIEEKLVVDEPKVEGGGFQPTVDEWHDIRTEINL